MDYWVTLKVQFDVDDGTHRISPDISATLTGLGWNRIGDDDDGLWVLRFTERDPTIPEAASGGAVPLSGNKPKRDIRYVQVVDD